VIWLFVVVLTGLVAVVLWFVLRGRPNQGIELGSNRPFPEGYGTAEPPYLPTPVVSDAEEFRLHAEETLAREERRRREHGSA
jgi:hypothetical protein